MENRQNKPKERNSLLKQYYGINGKAAINSQSAASERPYDLDGNTFNSSMYFANLLKEKSLRELVEVDSALVTEIREIDGDMKTLVYENYNKFISATDTIRKMRSNVESMECEMSRLNENIKTISDQTEAISHKLGPDRDKIQQLSTAHNSLKRLQFIFDLPHRLQSYADKKKYRQAIQYYSKARPVLDRIKAFSSIQRECKDIIESIQRSLWKEIETDSVEKIRLLILLEEDPSALRKEYIRIQTLGLEQEKQTNTAQELISSCLEPLDAMVQQFDELFLTEDLSKEEIEKDLMEVLDPFIDTLFDQIQQLTQLPKTIPAEGEFQQLEYLNQLKSYPSCISKVNDRMSLFDQEWKKQLADTLFHGILGGIQERIERFIGEFSPEKTETDSIVEFIQSTQGWMTKQMVDVCLQLKKHLGDVTQIKRGLNETWEVIATFLSNVKASHMQTVFVISRLCYDLADNSIFEIYSSFSHNFYSTGFRAPIHSALLPELEATVEKFSKVGQGLLNEQTVEEGYRISSRLQEAYLENNVTELTGVSPILCTLLDRLEHIESTMRSVFPSSKVQNTPAPDLGQFGTSTMMNNIDKLFAERIDIYRPVEPDSTAVYLGLLIILLKTLLEVTRIIRMDTVQCQQIQLDVEYIGQRVWSLAGDKNWTPLLLQEIVSSAYSRCRQPERLNLNELEMILASL